MPVSMLHRGSRLRLALAAALLLVHWACFAEASIGTDAASARIALRIVVPPVFRVLQITQVPGGHEYRIWTNMRVAQFNGRIYSFGRVGEATLMVPGPMTGLFIAPDI